MQVQHSDFRIVAPTRQTIQRSRRLRRKEGTFASLGLHQAIVYKLQRRYYNINKSDKIGAGMCNVKDMCIQFLCVCMFALL